MVQRRDCSVIAPTSPIKQDEAFDLVVDVELVNNALVCKCVTVAVSIGGKRINTFTVEVPQGGDLTGKKARVTTPVQAADHPSGELSVSTEIINEASGCGSFCSTGVDRGLLETG